MAKTQVEPHILVGADPALTRLVWRQYMERPFILALNRSTLLLGDPRNRFGDLKVHQFLFERLVGHLFYGRPDQEAMIDIQGILGRVRQHFNLPEKSQLTTVVVGNHFSMASALKVGDGLGSVSLERFFMKERMRERRLGCLVGAALERIEGVKLCWLSDVLGDMKPTDRTSEYDSLVKDVRALLRSARATQLAGAPKTLLKLPTSPRIYVRNAGVPNAEPGPWRPLEVTDRPRGPFSVSSFLIEQFLIARFELIDQDGPELEGVLVKVLGSNLSRHSPADTPIITTSQRNEAKAAGLKAILLDARRGVVFPTGPFDEEIGETMPVYGV